MTNDQRLAQSRAIFEMTESLLEAIKRAGGTIDPDRLGSMSVMELIATLAPNDIRFTYTKNPPYTINIVFDGPPSYDSSRFIKVEDQSGQSLDIGEWVYRSDGFWALRIDDPRK